MNEIIKRRRGLSSTKWESTPLSYKQAKDVAEMFGHKLPEGVVKLGAWTFWAEVSFDWYADENPPRLAHTQTILNCSHPEFGESFVILHTQRID